MVAALLGVIVLLQQQPGVSARVDRARILVGDSVTFTITVHARGDQPVEIVNPGFAGFSVLGTREQSQVRMDGETPVRVTTRVVALRALRPGTMTIGPVRVNQGGQWWRSTAVAVTVMAAGADVDRVLGERLRGLIERSEPPPLTPDDVSATVVLSSDSVVLGAQLDLVVIAWFPRAIRSRLRNPPTLTPPQLQGAWSYDRPTPTGIALSRRVNDVWYDLFVHHEVVFPLTMGRLNVGPATVAYSLPLSYSFLSRELRHEVESPPRAVYVQSTPSPPAHIDQRGAAGSDLELSLEASERDVPLGGAVTVQAVLQGRGNVALWAPPDVEWPAGLRIYPGDEEVTVNTVDGLVGGTKVFSYLAVADSVGTFRLPPVSFAYYDLRARRYRVLRAAPLEFVVRGAAGQAATLHAKSPPLIRPTGGPLLRGWPEQLPVWLWLVIGLVPPMLTGMVRGIPWGRKRFRALRRSRPPGERATLNQLDREFRGVLAGLVTDAHHREGDGLADALRAAGVEAPVAAHAARVRDRLRLALYGPEGTTDSDELAAEVHEVLRALVGTMPAGRDRSGVALLMLVPLLLAWSNAQGQVPEQLYRAGAVRAAADSFARRAETNPEETAHWYNLGSAWYRLGERAEAQAAWLHAARLRPRAQMTRQALSLAPAPDPVSATLTWVAPLTPGEALAGATTLWILGWVLVTMRARTRYAGIALAVALLAAAYGARVATRYAQPVALVGQPSVVLRVAPYGTAVASRSLVDGTAVIVDEARGPWVLVRHGVDRGWVLSRELVRL